MANLNFVLMFRLIPKLIPAVLLLILPFSLRAQNHEKMGDSLKYLISQGDSFLTERRFTAADSILTKIQELGSPVKTTIPFIHRAEIKLLESRLNLYFDRAVPWDSLYNWIIQNKNQFASREETIILIRLLNNTGIAFKRASKLTDSQKAYIEATEALKRLQEPDYFLQGSILANAGNAIKQLGEFTRAIDYFEQAARNFDSYILENPTGNSFARAIESKGQNLNNLGLIYQGLGDHQQAIITFKNCIEFKRKSDPEGLKMVSTNLSISLIETGLLQQADSLLREVLSSYPDKSQIDRIWVQASLNRADLILKLARDTAAFYAEIRRIQKIIRVKFPQAVDLMSTASLIQIRTLRNQSKYREALQETSRSLAYISLNKTFNTDGTGLPAGFQTNMSDEFIKLMDLRAGILMLQGLAERDTGILKSALENFDFVCNLIDSVNRSLQNQSSRIALSRSQRATYNNLINLASDLFHFTGDSIYIDQCFNYMEQSKSAGLWASIRESDVKTALIPEDQLAIENTLKTRIADVQGELIEKRSADQINTGEIEILENLRFSLNSQLDSLIQSFREDYPEYYKIKFDTSIFNLTEVKARLLPRQILIEYAITNDRMVIIAATTEKTSMISSPFTTEIENGLLFLLDMVKGKESSFERESLDIFYKTGNQLFKILLGQIEMFKDCEELIIIPDGILTMVPFEILLTESNGGLKPDFRTLPYLVRDKVINYGYTASLIFYSSDRPSKPISRVLAVAPDYSMSQRHIPDLVLSHSESLPDLAGITREARDVNRIAGGRILLDKAATEQKFKRIVNNFSVLHLAMHALPDHNEPLNTCLVFTPVARQAEDGLLYAYEIYNLKLNASLTVLSACETGSGELVTGEGILSLARGFIYSGCPNLIMTLWTVDDRSSQKLMELFYRHLNTGMKIGQALRQGKISYIEKADQIHAHPHFWAGYIELGKNQYLVMPQETGKLRIIVPWLALVLIVSVLMIRPRRLFKSGRRHRMLQN